MNVEFVNTVHVLKYICQFCKQIFYFIKKLHRYVRICRKLFLNNFVVTQYINVKTLKKKTFKLRCKIDSLLSQQRYLTK